MPERRGLGSEPVIVPLAADGGAQVEVAIPVEDRGRYSRRPGASFVSRAVRRAGTDDAAAKQRRRRRAEGPAMIRRRERPARAALDT